MGEDRTSRPQTPNWPTIARAVLSFDIKPRNWPFVRNCLPSTRQPKRRINVRCTAKPLPHAEKSTHRFKLTLDVLQLGCNVWNGTYPSSENGVKILYNEKKPLPEAKQTPPL
jgi:hypothetical protein